MKRDCRRNQSLCFLALDSTGSSIEVDGSFCIPAGHSFDHNAAQSAWFLNIQSSSGAYCCDVGARLQIHVYEPGDKMLLTIDPLLSATKARPHIKHTITLLDPVAGQLL